MQVDENIKKIVGIRFMSCNDGMLRIITDNGVKFTLSFVFNTLSKEDVLSGLTSEQIDIYL